MEVVEEALLRARQGTPASLEVIDRLRPTDLRPLTPTPSSYSYSPMAF